MSDAALIDRFLEMMAAERGASRNTLAAYRRDLGQAAEWVKGRLADADAGDLRKLMADYRSLAASSAARKLSALRQFFAFLLDEGERTDNPALDIARPATRRPLPRILTHDHVERLFAQADHVVNKEVKNALFLKNDALAIAEELANALAESESASFEPMVAASKDAQAYDAAYRHAAAAYACREVYRALAACEDTMARAVALARHVPLPETLENVTANVDEARMAFVWKELKDMAQSRPEAERFPVVEELGSLDLGAFANRQFLSVAKVAQLRGIQARQRDAEMGNASTHEGTATEAVAPA